MKKIDISIIVPAFNCEAYLPALLDSLRSQSGVSIEIIVINDGSTDNSLSVLEGIAHLDSRLVIVNQQNQGLSAARNTGIARATGTWIAFADGDDWLAPDALLTWMKQAEEQQLDVLISNGFAFTAAPQLAARSILLRKQPWGEVLNGQQWIIRSVEHHEWPHYVWLQFIRRDLINTHQLAFIPGMLHEDILWTTHLALAAPHIGYCDTPFYGYRTNPQSITHSSSTRSLLKRAGSYIRIIKELVNLATTKEPTLGQALLRHANKESSHLLGLMRKRLQASPERSALAVEFRNLSLPAALFRGAGDIHAFWRALRCSLTLARMARQNHSKGE
jgi:glycosyltransferase involved in cell wall biosynthesis